MYSGAEPVLLLDLGGGEFRSANYLSGNDSSTLTFAYDVQPGDAAADLDYNGTRALTTAGGLTDLVGIAANLTLPASGLLSSKGPAPVRVDAVRPSVVSVSSPAANGTYTADEYVNVTVSFDEAVYAAGAPLIELATGGAGRNATYASGNGSSVLAFDYTVVRGDRADDLDYTGTDSLSLDGGAIMDAAGNHANLTLPSPGANGSLGHSKDIGIDAAPPSVVSVSSPGGNGTYGTGRIVEIAVLLDEPVELGGGEPSLTLGTDPLRHAEYAGGGNGNAELRFLYTVQPGDRAALLDYAPGEGALSLEGGSIVDDAGNAAEGAVPLPEPGSPGSLGDSNRIGILGGPLPVLAANGSAVDNRGGYALGGAAGVDVIEAGGAAGGALALVAARTEGGGPNPGAVQLIHVRPNGTLSPGGVVTNDGSNRLYQPTHFAVFEMGGLARAIVSAGNSISLLDVHPNGTVSINDTANDMGNSPGGAFDRLQGAAGASVFEAGGDTYAIVASNSVTDGGLQLARILPNGTLSANGSARHGDGGLVLSGASDVGVIRAGDGDAASGPPRAIVASSSARALQLVTVPPNGTMSHNGSAVHGTGGFALDGASRVAVFAMGAGGEGGGNSKGRTHALVSSSHSHAVQLVRILPNGTLAAAGLAVNGTGGFDSIYNVADIAVFEMGGWTYAVASSFSDDGIQLFRINLDGTMVAEGSAAGGDAGEFGTLVKPDGVAVFGAGGRTYALVAAQTAASRDGAVQLVRLSPASVTGVHSPLQGGPHPAGAAINITVGFDEPVMLSDPAHPPSLLLALGGGINGTAEYLSGSGTAGLVFSYTVRPGDASSSLEYAHAGALTSRGAVTDMQGNAVDMGLPPPGEPGSLGRTSRIGIDTTPPSAVSVSSPNASRTYGAGSYVNITVRFDEAVYVGGKPLLALDAGAAGDDRHARYESGTGTPVLSFNYTVLPGDSAARLGYANTTALSLNGGAIHDGAGNDAGLALPPPGDPNSLGGSKDIEIDGVAPTVLSVSSPNGGDGGAHALGDSIRIDIEFSEAVSVDEAGGMPPTIALDTGAPGGARNAAYDAPGSAGRTLAFVYTVQDGDDTDDLDYAGGTALAANGAAIADNAGNLADLALPAPGSPESLGGPNNIEIDGVAPTVLSVSSPNGGDGGAHALGDSIRIDVEFSEDVSVDEAGGMPPTIALDTGAPGGARNAAYDAPGSAGRTLAFVYTVQDGDDTDDLDYAGGTALAANGAAIVDDAGNNASLALSPPGGSGSLAHSNDIEIDGVPPTVEAVTSPDADGAYGVGQIINITVSFDEAVLVAGSPRMLLDAGAAVRTATYDPAASAAGTLAFAYTVRQGDRTADLEYAGTGALDANGAAIVDDAGNNASLALPVPGSPESLGGSKDIAIDTTAQPGGPARVLLVESPDASGTYGAGSAINITVAFSMAVHVSGAPVLALSTEPPRSAEYVRGTDGDDELAFRYAVQDGDSAGRLGYAGRGALELGGGAITGADDGRNAVLVLPVPGSTQSLSASGIAIDTGGPGGNGGGPGGNGGGPGGNGGGPGGNGGGPGGNGGGPGGNGGGPGGNGGGPGGNGGGPGGNDPAAPAVVSVHIRGPDGGSATPAASYSAGQSILIAIEFSAPVTVRTSGGGVAAPYLELRTGSSGARAAYASGSGTDGLEFSYVVRGGDLAGQISYAGTDALILNGTEIVAVGTGAHALIALPEPGAPGSLSDPGGPAARIDPEPGRPVLDIGILDDDDDAGGSSGTGGYLSRAAMAAAYAFNERQGRTEGALIVNATAYDAAGGAAAGPAAAAALRAAHAGGSGPSVYVGPSTDRGLHAAMPYAAGNGIVLVSAGSTAPSLAVEGDQTFRLLFVAKRRNFSEAAAGRRPPKALDLQGVVGTLAPFDRRTRLFLASEAGCVGVVARGRLQGDSMAGCGAIRHSSTRS